MHSLIDRIYAHPNILWAPIRHHSPQCSFQLKALLAEHTFDRILVEGPSDAAHLLPHLGEASEPKFRARLPLAIYMYAVDRGSRTDTVPESRQRCYLPFAAMSPEWNAIAWAYQHDVPVEFIDLPFNQQLLYSQRFRDERSELDTLYYDESQIRDSDPLTTLLKKSDCQDFDQWWDRYFETGTRYQDAESFFRQLLYYCVFLRASLQVDAETQARDLYMAEKIRPYVDRGERCLVVCGGYHCLGIADALHQPENTIPTPLNALSSDAYLIPYTLRRLNSASGYAAGLPDSGYYHAFWETLHNCENPVDAAENAHQKMSATLLSTSRGVSSITTPDIIEANALCRRLGELRGYASGRREFKDALHAACAKNMHADEDDFHRLAVPLMVGDEMGCLPGTVLVPPLVEDFRQLSKRFKLPQNPGAPLTKVLEIFRKANHRELSRLLHALAYLRIPYAHCESGPQFATGQAIERVREKWQVSWQESCEPALIECAHLGESIREAALNKLLQALHDPNTHDRDKCDLLVKALVMGLHPVIQPVLKRLTDWASHETSAVALAQGLRQLSLAYVARSALEAEALADLPRLMGACFERFCQRLPWENTIEPTGIDKLAQALIDVFGLVIAQTLRPQTGIQIGEFMQALDLLRRETPASKVSGVCTGILLANGSETVVQTEKIFAQTFGHAHYQPEWVGDFLWGFLSVAKAHFLQEDKILEMVSQTLANLDEADFINALPALRLAFTHLNPREKHGLVSRVTGDKCNGRSLNLATAELEHALAIRQLAGGALKAWGYSNE